MILKRFEKLLGYQTKKIVFKGAHGWRYAYNKSTTSAKYFWNKQSSLGVCGDWFVGPKAEDAWLSARSLYYKIKKKPS